MSKFDAASLAPSTDAVEVEIYNPRTKSGTGIYVTVLGKDSDVYRDTQRAQQNRRFKHLGRSRAGGLQLTAEEIENEALELLVTCTKSWRSVDDGKSSPVVELSGKALEYSPANVRALYTEVPVIREQVDDAIHDRSTFMKS